MSFPLHAIVAVKLPPLATCEFSNSSFPNIQSKHCVSCTLLTFLAAHLSVNSLKRAFNRFVMIGWFWEQERETDQPSFSNKSLLLEASPFSPCLSSCACKTARSCSSPKSFCRSLRSVSPQYCRLFDSHCEQPLSFLYCLLSPRHQRSVYAAAVALPFYSLRPCRPQTATHPELPFRWVQSSPLPLPGWPELLYSGCFVAGITGVVVLLLIYPAKFRLRQSIHQSNSFNGPYPFMKHCGAGKPC